MPEGIESGYGRIGNTCEDEVDHQVSGSTNAPEGIESGYGRIGNTCEDEVDHLVSGSTNAPEGIESDIQPSMGMGE